MESESRPQIIVPKTPDQIRQQTRLLRLQPYVQLYKPGPPQEFLDDPATFRLGLADYRTSVKSWEGKHGKSIPPPPDSMDEKYRSYEKYLKAFRRIRKEQSGHIHKAVRGRPEGASVGEAYFEAARYSPDIGKNVLQRISKSTGGGNAELFTEEEIAAASATESGFYALVDKGLNQVPNSVYTAFDQLRYVLPKEKLKEAILKARGHSGFLDRYRVLKPLLSPEEQKALLVPLVQEGRNGYLVVKLLEDPDAAALFSPAEIKSVLITAFSANADLLRMPQQIRGCLDKGMLTPDDVQTIVIGRVTGFQMLTEIDKILPMLPNPQSLEAVKRAIVDTYTNKAVLANLGNLHSVSSLLTPEQKYQIVKQTLARDKFQSGYYISSYEGLIAPGMFVPLLKEAIYDPETQLTGYGVGEILHAQSLSVDDKSAYIDHLISTGRGPLLLTKIRENLFSFSDPQKRDEIARKILTQIDTVEIAQKYTGFEGWDVAVSEGVLADVLEAAGSRSIVQWLYYLDIWAPKAEALKPGLVLSIVEKFKETKAPDLLFFMDKLAPFIPSDKIQGLVHRIVSANPPIALVALQENPATLQGLGTEVSGGSIVALGSSDQERMSFAPKTLRDFYKQISTAVPMEEQKSLLIETHNIYRAIALIKSGGLEAAFRKIQEGKDLSPTAEKELVAIFYCFALLKEASPGQFAGLETLGATPEESKQILFSQFAGLLGLERQFTPQEVSQFFGTMETPVPFMIYLLQHRNSEPHKKLLTEIFESITSGKFSEWKFGPLTPEAFDMLKEAKLLPEKLTIEQYALWRADGQTTLFESLATDTETTANAVKKFLEGNLNHLEIEEVMDRLTQAYPDQDPESALQQDLGSLGQRLAVTNRELSGLRKQADSANEGRIAELEQEKVRLEDGRRILIRARKIFRLAGLQPDEVASGYFLEGKDRKQRGDSIAKVLGELKESSAQENGFIYDGIKDMLDSLRTASDEKQNLVATDSSDPKVWIEIGEKPVTSCQSYDGGGFNECLLAYTDPDTKFLILRNQRGKIIARSVFRLLETGDGDPALHIERIYSSTTSKGVIRSMFARAYQKAEELGVPLYMSGESQDEGGVEKPAPVAEGYRATAVQESLFSRASRAPKAYVDSAGGVQTDGKFELKNLMEIRKSA